MRALIDTSALLALSHGRDQYHETAVAIAEAHRSAGGRFVGTTSILTEFHSHLLYLRDGAVARTALTSLLADPMHEWLEVDADLVGDAAGNWLLPYEDQRFSLVAAAEKHHIEHRFKQIVSKQLATYIAHLADFQADLFPNLAA